MTSLNQLESLLIGYRPGQRVAVEVLRAGHPRQITVTLGSLAG